MFGKPNVLSLLAKADKADATAEKALSVAKKARSEAARQRIFADRVEAEEVVARFVKRADASEILTAQAAQDFQLTQQVQNDADAALKAADRNVELAWKHLEGRKTESKFARTAAKEAQSRVAPSEYSDAPESNKG